ncbi:hypothetical protein PIB30_097223, partial [Stylosanthes scabra]|nr:hypothetical protein [Stylosanthes scabra]
MCDVYISSGLLQLPSFTSYLFSALKNAGLYVLGNYTEPNTSDLKLSGAIEGSRVSIIVFSMYYANSTMCLRELEKIMECRSSRHQQVVPVFLDFLDPSDVRNLSGYFGEVLLDTLERNSTDANNLLTYRTALREASAISPSFLPNIGNESKVIEDIVAHVTSLLDSTDLFVAEHPVGVNSRVQDLIQLINNHKSDHVPVIAIWGMAGIGKTTIAKALYNQISRNFDVRKFVPDIKERLRDISWHLHKSLLSALGISVKRKVPNLDSTSLTRDSHCNSKVFLVIDNVTSDLELQEILSRAGDIREFFGPGSVVIIVTRVVNADPFSEIQVNHIYRVKEMDYNECVELFSWSAFKKATPERSFSGLINYAVEYSDGLPLALMAVGSALSKKNMEEWENLLDRLNRFPLQDAWQILKESIDSVEYSVRKMFFGLAYLSHFLIGMDRNDISQLLKEAGNHEAPRAIKVLENHSLVWFNEDKLCMHRLLQHIGREMYLQESSIESQ